MADWHDDDSFWIMFAPFMFHEKRWSGTTAEIDALVELSAVAPRVAVLDLGCGPGRHTLELARRGYRVTGVDRTRHYLQLARGKAEDEWLNVEFVQADMREFSRPESFDMAINLFTTFGYFADPADNLQVLKNIHTSLRPGGVLVMELSGKEILARTFTERDWQEIDGVIFLEERRVVDHWSRIQNQWTLISGAVYKRYEFSLWIYSAVELEHLLGAAGFGQVEFFDGLQGRPYDQNANRLTAVARK